MLNHKGEVATEIKSLAQELGIAYVATSADVLANHFTRLSDNDVPDLDETQMLLLAFRRAGYLDKFEMMRLQAAYLAQKHIDI